MYTVYALEHPETSYIFYVGIAEDVYARYIQHLKMSEDNPEKYVVIAMLKAAHLVPILRTLDVVKDKKEAERREAFHIERLRLMKHPLTNRIHWTAYKTTLEERKELESIGRFRFRRRENLEPENWLDRILDRLFGPWISGKAMYDERAKKWARWDRLETKIKKKVASYKV